MSIQAVKAIDGIRFSVWSPTEIRKYSVAEITAPETYDEDGMPVQGGLMDGRLGTLEPGQKCLTCGNTAARCPGHFGHLELAEPVLHIAFIDNIYKLLQSTCRSCASLKVPQEDLNIFKTIKEKHAATPREALAGPTIAEVPPMKLHHVQTLDTWRYRR